MNVLEAAVARMTHLVNSYDNVVVSYSGGKDSLVCLLVLRETYKRLGLKKKVESVFIDEEFLSPITEKYITWLKTSQTDWLNLQWLVTQMESELITLNGVESLIQWDKNRSRYLREIPKFAIRDTDSLYDIYTGYRAVRKLYPRGSLAVVTGIRTEESSARRMIISGNAHKGFFCFLTSTENEAITKAIPIYDWKIADVFKYLHDEGFLNEIYNHQMWSGSKLRVDTPLHGKARHDINHIKKYNPEFYEKLVEMFPHLHALQIYSHDLFTGDDRDIWKYPEHTWEGLVKWCNEKFKDDAVQLKQALMCVKRCYKSSHSVGSAYPPPFKGYPLLYVWRQIKNLNFDKAIMPLYDKQINRRHYEFEGREVPEALKQSPRKDRVERSGDSQEQ